MAEHQKEADVKSYILASCKPWHYEQFEHLRSNLDAKWRYVSCPRDLDEALSEVEPKYIFFLHWNWIVPEAIFGRYECVCFHMTDVPYGRGGSPLQNLILAGHTSTKLTALRMVKELDAGPVYCKKPLSLDGSAGEIYVRCGKLCAELINFMIEHNPQPTPQAGDAVIFTRRTPDQSRIPCSGGLRTVYDYVRMLDADGYPHAFLEYGDFVLKLKNARLKDDCVVAEVEIKLREVT